MARQPRERTLLNLGMFFTALFLAGFISIFAVQSGADERMVRRILGYIVPLLLVVPLLTARGGLFVVALLSFLLPDARVPMKQVWFSMRWVMLGLMGFSFVLPSFLRRSSGGGPSLPMSGVVWGCWILLTYVYSVDPTLTIVKACVWLSLFLVAFVGMPHLLERIGVERIMKGLLQANLFLVVGSLFYLLTSPGSTVRGSGLRGIIGNSNGLGLYLLMTGPAVFYFLVTREETNWWYRLVLGLNVMMVAVSLARGAAVGALTGWLILAVLASPRRLKIHKRLITTTVIGLLMYLGVITVASRANVSPLAWLRVADEPNPVLSARMQWWEEDLKFIMRRPMLGYGFGVVAGAGKWELSSWTGFVRERGSSPLGIWEETGLVGLVLFYLFMFQVLMRAARLIRRAREAYPEPEAAAAYALVFVLVTALVESVVSGWLTATGSFPAFLFYLTAGAVWALEATWGRAQAGIPREEGEPA